MLTANEARKKTENSINNCVTKELLEIMKKIENAVANGKFSITNDGYLKVETKQKLEELGYQVKIDIKYNENHYSVSW